MGRPIPEDVIAEVLSRCSIVEILSEHLQLKRVGSGYQALCPFHADSKPSLYVNEVKGFFHCFGCGTGGNALHFLMKIRGMDFPEAVRFLASRVGVVVPEGQLSPKEQRLREDRAFLVEVNRVAASFFRRNLLGPQGEAGRKYLRDRGISERTQEIFQLGMAPRDWGGLLEHLRSKGQQWVSKAETLGLLVKGRGGSLYDRFRGRIVFPIQEESGEILGFGARALGSEEPKYLNSPESPLFSKSRCLYGLHLARGSIRELDEALVVEGYMDVLALHQAGISNAVGTLGTSLTKEHLLRLRRHSSNVVCLFDGDAAGERATLRAVDLCLEVGVWGRVIRLPAEHDPDSFLRKRGLEEMRRALEAAIPLMDFYVQKTVEKYKGADIQGKSLAVGEILHRLRRLKDPIVREHYVGVVARSVGLDQARLEELLRRHDRDPLPAKKDREAGPGAPRTVERLLVQCLLRDLSLVTALREDILEEMEDVRLRGLAAKLWELGGERDSVDAQRLHALVQDPEEARLLAELLAGVEEVGEDPDKVCEDCIRNLRRRSLDRRIGELGRLIHEARHAREAHRLEALEAERALLVVEKKRLGMSA